MQKVTERWWSAWSGGVYTCRNTWNTASAAESASTGRNRSRPANCNKQRTLATNERCSNHTGSGTVGITGGGVEKQTQLRQVVFEDGLELDWGGRLELEKKKRKKEKESIEGR